MRKGLLILFALLTALSCVGQRDDPAPEVRLAASATALNVTEGESALFTVYSGDEDVTEYAQIRNCTDDTLLPGAAFTPAGPGEWHFVAEYEGDVSEEVTIAAFEVATAGQAFFQRSLVLEFTGTWCVNCPQMETALEDIRTSRPGRVVQVAVHCLSIDPMAIPEGNELQSRFSVNNVCPSVIVDLDPESLITQSSPELVLSHIDRLLESRGPSAGVAVSTTLEEGLLTVEASLEAVRDGEYAFAVILLEDGIVAPQTGSTATHIHNHVLRAWQESGRKTVLEEGAQWQETFSLSASEHQRVAVAVLRNGLVDNVAVCPAGGSADFSYEETQSNP